jgi:glycine cleavage system transcriptional repressor
VSSEHAGHTEPSYAVTVVGRDRPGIVAETTARLAGLGLNLEDSTMILLRGHFAMMLICAGDVVERAIEDALAPLTIDRSLTVTVAEVPVQPDPSTGGSAWVLTVHGGDRPGIVSAVVAEVAAVRGNITDLTTRPAGDKHLLVAEIDVPADVDVTALEAAVDRVSSSHGARATLRRADR